MMIVCVCVFNANVYVFAYDAEDDACLFQPYKSKHDLNENMKAHCVPHTNICGIKKGHTHKT